MRRALTPGELLFEDNVDERGETGLARPHRRRTMLLEDSARCTSRPASSGQGPRVIASSSRETAVLFCFRHGNFHRAYSAAWLSTWARSVEINP